MKNRREKKTVRLIETPCGPSFCILPVLLVVAGMLLDRLLGQRHQSRGTGSPYEGGIVSVGSAKVRLSVKFYLIAMLFVAFDLETVFLLCWAVAARELGWPGFLEALVFTVILGRDAALSGPGGGA